MSFFILFYEKVFKPISYLKNAANVIIKKQKNVF